MVMSLDEKQSKWTGVHECEAEILFFEIHVFCATFGQKAESYIGVCDVSRVI